MSLVILVQMIRHHEVQHGGFQANELQFSAAKWGKPRVILVSCIRSGKRKTLNEGQLCELIAGRSTA